MNSLKIFYAKYNKKLNQQQQIYYYQGGLQEWLVGL
jgi:hypothetical protein